MKDHASLGVPRDGNGAHAVIDVACIGGRLALDDVRCVRSGVAVVAMDVHLRVEMRGPLVGIRDVVLMTEKNLGDAAGFLEGLS